MSSFSRLPILLLCAASLARAQTVPPAPPAHTHAHAQTDPHGIVTLDQFVASAAPFGRNQVDLAQSTTVLGGRALQLKQQATLGETLAAETGMAATSFGPGASRPVIRGLGGDRIRLLENGTGTLDASVASPDHAVSVEPFLVERIEVMRGPAALLYGSNAVGGAINVITHRIETDVPTEAVRGGVEVRGATGADEFARGGVLDFALPVAPGSLVVHLDGFRRDADNLRIPGFAESARIRAEETEHAAEEGEPAPAFARGRLPNSALEAQSAAVGLSFVTKDFHLGASYSGFDTVYGVPGHAHGHGNEHGEEHGEEEHAEGEAEGVRIDLRQRRTDVQGEWHADAGALRGVRFKVGHADYVHTELEPDGVVGTVFANRGYDGRVELLHGDGGWSGAVGVQAARSDFRAEGDEAFLPPSLTRSAAVFAFEEVAAGPLTWQFGARLERTRTEAPAVGGARRDTEASGALGAVWKLDAAHTLAVSVTHTGRAPNAQELFADGPHAGTQAYEIGDAALGAERALGAELSLRRRTGFVTGAVTLFTHRFDGYLFERPTGLVAVEHDGAWEFLPPDDDEVEEHGGGLPVYRTVQRDARFWGAELETLWHLHDRGNWQLDLRLAADLVRARAAGEHLPRIPARRTTVGLAWAHGAWSAGAESQFVAAQRRTAPNETGSNGYALVSVYAGRTFAVGRGTADVFLRAGNLLDEEARPHTSFVKELAPLGGRSLTAGVRFAF